MKKQIHFLTLLTFCFASLAAVAQNPDATVEEIGMDDVYAAGSPETVNIKFKNAGTQSFSGITLNWSTDNGATVNSYALPGFPFAPNNSFTLAHNVKVTFANPGAYTSLKVWTSNPGGMTDVNTSNDTLVKQIFVNNGTSVTKNVLIEEFTTSVCQFCPDGAYTLENVLVSNPNAIGVGIHAGFGTDGMTIPEHSMVASAFTTSAPAAAIDRFRFTTSGILATASRSLWNSRTALRGNEIAPVDIDMVMTYNNVTRQAIVTLTANYVDYALPADYRMGLYVVEDSVIGPIGNRGNNGWNQVNFYNTQAGHPYYQKGNPILGYAHRHVVRDVMPVGNPWGEAGVIPSAPVLNGSYSTTYTFQINSAWDLDRLSFVAYVVNYNSSVYERSVVNAKEIKFRGISTRIEEQTAQLGDLDVFPNPANDQFFLDFKLKSQTTVSMQLMDMTGKLILDKRGSSMAKGSQLITIPVADLDAGIYFVRLQAGDQIETRKISVLH